MVFARTVYIWSIFVTLFSGLHINCWSFIPLRQIVVTGNKSDKTEVALFPDTLEVTASWIDHGIDSTIILSSEEYNFGGLVGKIGLILSSAAIGGFLFANIVYTPEILKGAEQLRQSNREIEIRKLLVAIHTHEENGNELVELRLPLETALGTTLEDYIMAVDSSLSKETTDQAFTTADQDLANILKKKSALLNM